MSLYSPIIDQKIKDYIIAKSVKEHPILQRIISENKDHKEAFIQIPPEQAQLISILVKMMKPKKSLELGSFFGYSTLSIAFALPGDGKLIACEINSSHASKALQYIDEAGMSKKVEMKIGPAIETLNYLISTGHSNSFDFIFIDADKENYIEYYELSIGLIRSGGVIAIDNVLWYGRIFDKTDNTDLTKIIRKLNDLISKDERVDKIIIPIGDGMTLAIKK